MIAPCSECKKNRSLSELYVVVYDKDGLHLLCSKECKEQWEESRNSLRAGTPQLLKSITKHH